MICVGVKIATSDTEATAPPILLTFPWDLLYIYDARLQTVEREVEVLFDLSRENDLPRIYAAIGAVKLV